MKVGIAGGGPAGLYLAALLKDADPAHEVIVVERNPPDATFGWGVVFSEETLSELRDADYPTFLAFEEHLVRWNALDIRYRGDVIRSRGHGFSAISRKVLLALLQGRCRDLGVELRYRHELDDLGAFAGCDVVVGADGVNSMVRRALAGDFHPSLHHHPTRYAWFGSDLVFDAFTFIFAETAHGLVQVHAYPFDGATSTFIVETTEETWRRAGLDEMTEQESLAFCEELFADHLAGHKLLSNRSLWTSFVTVRNRAWHAGNVVLVGDAAATAHFSIGSGTKLAMEGAVALAKAFQAHPGDLGAAFADYELERRPAVDRFQRAALDSAGYFETVSRYLGFAPEQFAFNLLTRSGRITHLELARRDPALVNRVDRYVAGRQVIAPPPPATTSLDVGGVRLPNRVVLGEPGRGAGLVVTELVAISEHARLTPETPGLYDELWQQHWAEMVVRAHAAGERVAVRLGHAGRRGATRPPRLARDWPLPPGEAWGLLGPTAEPYTARSQVPRAMTAQDEADVLDDFATATRRAAAGGVDVLLVDCSDGYLLHSFLSPLTNPAADRARYPLEVFRAVRAEWPGGRPLGVRLAATDWLRGGLDPDDVVAFAATLAAEGCSLVDVAAGGVVPRGAPDYRRGYLVPFADRIRNEAGVATVAGGRVTTLDEVSTIVAAGRAELVRLDPGPYYSSS